MALCLHCILAGAPARAEEVRVAPLLDARVSAEHIEQVGPPEDDAYGITLRVRPGVEASFGDWSALLQGLATFAPVDDYYDGLHGPETRPIIADPETLSLHRAQVRYNDGPFAATIGRQRISLDDDRFVDQASVRQNGVTYDGVRFQWAPPTGLRADVSYVWNVRTIWGEDGAGNRPDEISGENVFANLAYKFPEAEVTAYAYLVDQHDPTYFGHRLSSQTYGVRLAGVHAFSDDLRLHYQASAATQRDYGRNPNEYIADFYLLDAALEYSPLRIGIGYEVSGADDGEPLTSFQFPYGSGFRYRGNVGKFQLVPPDGLRDAYLSLAYAARPAAPFDSIRLQATYHAFSSDRNDYAYGDELDLSANAQRGAYTFALRFSDYTPDNFSTRTQKLAFQVEWTF